MASLSHSRVPQKRDPAFTHHRDPNTHSSYPCTHTPHLVAQESQTRSMFLSPTPPSDVSTQPVDMGVLSAPYHLPVCVSTGEWRGRPLKKSELCSRAGWLRCSAPRITCPSNALAPVSLFLVRHCWDLAGVELGVEL